MNSMPRALVLSPILLATLAGVASAGPGLGAPQQLSIQGDFQIQVTRTTVSAADGEDDQDDPTTLIVVLPAIDYFVGPNLSLGGTLGMARASQGDSTSTGFLMGPRVGYVVALSERVALWPRLSILFANEKYSSDFIDASGRTLTLIAHAPLLFQPADHFFLGLGPVFNTELISEIEDEEVDRSTSFGLLSTVGGWF